LTDGQETDASITDRVDDPVILLEFVAVKILVALLEAPLRVSMGIKRVGGDVSHCGRDTAQDVARQRNQVVVERGLLHNLKRHARTPGLVAGAVIVFNFRFLQLFPCVRPAGA